MKCLPAAVDCQWWRRRFQLDAGVDSSGGCDVAADPVGQSSAPVPVGLPPGLRVLAGVGEGSLAHLSGGQYGIQERCFLLPNLIETSSLTLLGIKLDTSLSLTPPNLSSLIATSKLGHHSEPFKPLPLPPPRPPQAVPSCPALTLPARGIIDKRI